jgi:hypothetical protein
MAFALKTSREVGINRRGSIDPTRATVTVGGINRLKIPGSFAVHLFKDGKQVGSKFMFQPAEPDKCETCVKNAFAHFDFNLPLSTVAGGKLHAVVEPMNKGFVGSHFPAKLMGDPTISVNLPLQTN